MIGRRAAAIATVLVLALATPAEAGFWGDLKRSLGTAADNAEKDGAKAADAVGDAAGDAADAVVEGAGDAADLVTGDTADPTPGAVEASPAPVAKGATPSTEQPEQ